jgi:predicted Zn-dependent protease with MMP-like domain
MLDMPRDEFEGLVSEALDLIPPELTALMRNVVVLVEDDRPDPDLAAITGC